MAEKPNIRIGNIVISALMIMAGIVMAAVPSSVPVKVCGWLIIAMEVMAILRAALQKRTKK